MIEASKEIVISMGKGAKDLLVEIYGDLARPGIRQVGKALETVVQTGALALIPLRLANTYAAEWERKKFADIAERFADIPEEEIEPARPEIAVPVLEALDYTDDADLRGLFVELLASASHAQKANFCHPSFVNVIKNLSSEEGRMLQEWAGRTHIPYLEISNRLAGSSRQVISEIHDLPDAIDYGHLLPVFLSNLAGLGILEKSTMRWLRDEEYSELIEHAKRHWVKITPSLTQAIDLDLEEGKVIFDKGIVEVLPYGRLFQKACLPVNSS